MPKIIINGNEQQIQAHSLPDILVELGHAKNAAIATAVNGDFVPAHQRAEIELQNNDKLEILAPMKGG